MTATDLRAVPLTVSALPATLSSFIGRERQIADVERLLAGGRLITLTGAGGSGKTRLALAVAERLQVVMPGAGTSARFRADR